MAVSELTIHKLGPQGDGAHLDAHGRVYVERSMPGDRIKARLYKDGEGIWRGDLIEILAPSPHRQSPPCPHYENCGNCTLQHLNQEYYRRWKSEVVKEVFHRYGLRPRRWLKTIFIGPHLRRRVTLTALKRRGQVTLGYYRRRSGELTDISSCLIAEPKLLSVRERMKPFLPQLLSEGQPTDIFLQLVGNGIDMVFTGPLGHRGLPDPTVRPLVAQLLEASGVSRISWRASEEAPIEILLSQGPVTTRFGPLDVSVPPAAFLQPTLEGEKALATAVLSALPAQGRFADLFSGCGTFSGPMLTHGSVDAYESVPSAVRALAKATGSYPLRVFRRDLVSSPLRREELDRYDAVVFDPPRAGCAEQAFTMASAKTHTLIGVSCNAATFARDARILCEGGYWLQSLQVIDQFQWSHHVEVVGVFTKRKRAGG